MRVYTPERDIAEKVDNAFPYGVGNDVKDAQTTIIRIASEVLNEYLNAVDNVSDNEYEVFLSQTTAIAYDILLKCEVIGDLSEIKVKALIRKATIEE